MSAAARQDAQIDTPLHRSIEQIYWYVRKKWLRTLSSALPAPMNRETWPGTCTLAASLRTSSSWQVLQSKWGHCLWWKNASGRFRHRRSVFPNSSGRTELFQASWYLATDERSAHIFNYCFSKQRAVSVIIALFFRRKRARHSHAARTNEGDQTVMWSSGA